MEKKKADTLETEVIWGLILGNKGLGLPKTPK